MRLYSGMSSDFIRDTIRNQIAERLRDAFFNYFRYQPGPAEVNSWRNSLRAMKDVVQSAGFLDHGILLEYQLPLSSKRIDCMICGHDEADNEQAVIVELKQWDSTEHSESDKLVRSWVGGKMRDLLHPSVQAGQYRYYLEDTHSAFHEEPNPIRLSSCSYLHNYVARDDDPIRSAKFADTIRENPLFDADGADDLGEFLRSRVVKGQGRSILEKVEKSTFRPSKKLMENVAATIKSHSPWVLLDE